MDITPFKLERYFARWEFAAPYLLCNSDVESYKMSDLLALADKESQRLWDTLSLGYTETQGHPLLRQEIAKLYDESITPEHILMFAGGEEGIFITMNVLLSKGDHAIVTWPGYQSLYSIAEATGADLTLLPLREEQNWQLDLAELRRTIRPNTRVIIINYPHNPTGAQLDQQSYQELLQLTSEQGIYLFSDESYRFLEYDPAQRLPAAANSPTGISLGVISKSFALAGLRIGWLATQDRKLLERAATFKDYVSICNSAPSEILTLIALRARKEVLARSLDILHKNLMHLDRFFEDWSDIVWWIRPQAGSIGFPRLLTPDPIDEFTQKLVQEEGVLLLPSSVFDYPASHFRIGFGRHNLPEVLNRFERFLQRHYRR